MSAKPLARARSRESKDIVTQILLRHSPPGSHSSNGMAELTAKSVEGLTRAYARDIQKHYVVVAKGNLAILVRIVRCAAFGHNRFTLKPSGRTPIEELKLIRYDSPVLAFGEMCTRPPVRSAGQPLELGLVCGHLARPGGGDQRENSMHGGGRDQSENGEEATRGAADGERPV